MFNIQNYVSFLAAILLFQLVPGPGTFFILNATAKKGVRAGMGAVCGTLAGDFVYMLAAALGLATVLSANPAFFSLLQWAGILYLCRIGWNLLRNTDNADADGYSSGRSNRRFFQQALAVSLTNPKVIMFFMAFFPPFMTVDSKPVTIIAMMCHVTLISLLYQTVLVLAGDRIARALSGIKNARLIAARLIGMALLGFGVKLALGNK